MLVLSRQKNQKVNFPGLGISVEILDIKGSKVRVGVDAPIEVRVLRDELPDHSDEGGPPGTSEKPGRNKQPHIIRLPQSLRHDLRNALHELSLLLHVYRKRSQRKPDTGAEPIEPEQLFEAIIRRLEDLGGHSVFSPTGLPLETPGAKSCHAGEALVIDDNDNERELLAGFLRLCGYRVDTARDGLDALESLDRSAPPRVILLDMQMPRCSGDEFLKRLRSIEAFDETHVFVISGQSAEEVGLSRKDGYAHWFNKPLDPRRVVERLTSIESGTACVA